METQMNKHHKSKIIATLFLLSITGVFNVLGETEGDDTVPTEQISNYKKWLKVTPKPHEVKQTFAGLGWSVDLVVIGDDKKSTPDAVKALQVSTEIPEDVFKVKESIKPLNPGLYGEVYINERAAKAVKEGKFQFTAAENKDAGDTFRFPTGSIIVREKIVVKDKSTVEALAVMIKRESSFNPQADGWQFLYLDPKTLAVTKNDQATCLSCHKEKKQSDFVFNSYKP